MDPDISTTIWMSLSKNMEAGIMQDDMHVSKMGFPVVVHESTVSTAERRGHA